MKKIKFIGGSLLVLGLIIAILLYNKSKSDAMTKKSETQDAFHVTVTTVTQQTLSEQLSLVGTIVANSDVPIVSETQGKVTSLHVTVGDYKPAGAVIAQVDDELRQAQLTMAEVNFQRAQKDLERYKSLNEQNSASDWQKETVWQQFKGAEAQLTIAKRQMNDTRIKMPISGIVTSKTIEVGTMVQPGMPVANVVDITRLKVKVNVSEQDAFKLQSGDEVKVTTDVYPGKEYSGRIASVGAKADESHTYPVEIVLPNSKDKPLKAGMFGRVHFTSIASNTSLIIPREALLGSVKNPQVFVVEKNVAKLRSIIIGDGGDGFIPVVGGLQAGEVVVVSGQNNLKDNVAVSVVK